MEPDDQDARLLEVARAARARGFDPVALISQYLDAARPLSEPGPGSGWLVRYLKNPALELEKIDAKFARQLQNMPVPRPPKELAEDIGWSEGMTMLDLIYPAEEIRRMRSAVARFPGPGRRKGSRDKKSRRREDVLASIREVDDEMEKLRRRRPEMPTNDREDLAVEVVARRRRLKPETLRKRLDRAPSTLRREN